MNGDQPSAPHRAHETQLTVSADTLHDLAGALFCIATQIEREGLSSWGISGGYSSGWRYDHQHRPEITHDAWAAANKAYVGALPGPQVNKEGGE